MAAVVLKSQLEAVGRERGPDIALKADKLDNITNAKLRAVTAAGGGAANYDVDQFNITEVLNVIAAVSNTTRDATAIDTKYSAYIPTCGGIVPGTGMYAAANPIVPPPTLVQQTTAPGGIYSNILQPGGGLGAAIFDFGNLTYTAPPGGVHLILPQCLLKRTTTANANVQDANVILNPLDLDPNAGNEIPKFIGDVFLQGFSILGKTREILGPKGWTALFAQVKGGGSSRSKHAKRTHRQHRRRYSSKQY
jgi:hypothetical protein